MRPLLILPLLISALSAQAPSGPPGARIAAIDALFAPWKGSDRPGAALVVTRGRDLVALRYYGMANLEHDGPIGAETVFDIASLSKQFAGYLIAQEERTGALRRDDRLRELLPNLPDAMAGIRLRHLIHHEGGVRDWPGALAAAGLRMDDVISEARLRDFVRDQRALNFAPGEGYLYSNTGYNLLAWILEARREGRSYAEILRERIFVPLGMTASYSLADSRQIASARADSYVRGAQGEWRRVHNGLAAPASSSVHTTARDLARWMVHLQAPTPEAAALVKAMRRTGARSDYAYGQVLHRREDGRELWQHSGSWAGFRSALLREAGGGFAVAVLGNAGDLPAMRLAEQTLEIFSPSRQASRRSAPAPLGPGTRKPPTRPRSEASPPESDLAGRYYSPELGATVEIRLLAEKAGIEWIRADGEGARLEYRSGRYRGRTWWCREIHFDRDAEGRVTGLRLQQGRNRDLLFRRRP
jgi:CubicO group peptidase (beta-lactamase class C family)